MSGLSFAIISFNCLNLASFPIPLIFHMIIFILNLFVLSLCRAGCLYQTLGVSLFSYALAPPSPLFLFLAHPHFQVHHLSSNSCLWLGVQGSPPPEHVTLWDALRLGLWLASARAALANSSNFIALRTSCTSSLFSPNPTSHFLAISSSSSLSQEFRIVKEFRVAWSVHVFWVLPRSRRLVW